MPCDWQATDPLRPAAIIGYERKQNIGGAASLFGNVSIGPEYTSSGIFCNEPIYM